MGLELSLVVSVRRTVLVLNRSGIRLDRARGRAPDRGSDKKGPSNLIEDLCSGIQVQQH